MLCTLAGIASRPSLAQTNLLTNGSFEEPRIPSTLDTTSLPPPTLPGWQITAGRATLAPYGSLQPADFQGRQSLLLGSAASPGSIEQSFPTTPGQYYLASGWLARNPEDLASPDVRAQLLLNGRPLATLVHSELGVSADYMHWRVFAYRFQATTSTTTLSLVGAGVALDGLAVTLAGAPGTIDSFFTIDLSGQINRRLFDGMLGVGGDLGDLGDTLTPDSPVKRLKGIPFLLDGVVLIGPGQTNGVRVPQKVEGIPVGRKATRLYFLHATHYGPQVAKGRKIGAYVLHYADGTSATIPIVNGVDLVDWWVYGAPTATGASVGWQGNGEDTARWGRFYTGRPYGIQLFIKIWQNPNPDQEIRSLDMVVGEQPGNSGVAPFLVAVTGS
jgi:hypothetical protein